MLTHPDPQSSSQQQQHHGLVPNPLHTHPAVFGLPTGSPAAMYSTSETPSSSDAGPSAHKRARTVSISQKTDEDDGAEQQEGKKKKAKGRAKGGSLDVKEEDREEKEKNRTGKACCTYNQHHLAMSLKLIDVYPHFFDPCSELSATEGVWTS